MNHSTNSEWLYIAFALAAFFFLWWVSRKQREEISKRLQDFFPNGREAKSLFSSEIFRMNCGDFYCGIHLVAGSRYDRAGWTRLVIKTPPIKNFGMKISNPKQLGILSMNADKLSGEEFIRRLQVSLGDPALRALLHQRSFLAVLHRLFSMRSGSVSCRHSWDLIGDLIGRLRYGQGEHCFVVELCTRLSSPEVLREFITLSTFLFGAYAALLSERLPQWQDKKFELNSCDRDRKYENFVVRSSLARFETPEVDAILNKKYPIDRIQFPGEPLAPEAGGAAALADVQGLPEYGGADSDPGAPFGEAVEVERAPAREESFEEMLSRLRKGL